MSEGSAVEETTEATSHALIGELCRCAVELIGAGRAGGSGLRRVRLQLGDSSVELEWPESVAATGGAPSAALSHGVPSAEVVPEADDSHHVCAPTVGTFYRAPEPGAPPFVGVGDTVEKGRQIGIVEAMKLMNPIEADRPGRVVEILASDGVPVEYGQPLFAIAPLDAP
ncbi:acetyl-CoA carboxylase biotin carboxyl carrier protein [Streptosporangium sp. NBC_01755]|uniref:acetyl-CoA carboxylase biotin carboxyl carrier protein n=1 Tax=unclassified Streptosporangium TaxID=2632669 RepID=UPI002DDB071B|nr:MULTISPECIES: acetyl-CoA carboxylase biotin carboxyl carrier protein [unclassified Streptosporangium]WSA25670.1 acetyl-CoA carboxylase biotin carboxyl carrier protein [Streptosporangium sp. NBC_01810]WSD02940.1 acetyl-CoA carboxylase biotin carboxyl carrier protein [Streptosporangium sp. NBC_01755]